MDTVPRDKQQEATRKFILEPLDPSLTAHIDGNAPVSIKELPVKWLAIFRSRGNGFCNDIAERVVVTEVSIVPRIENPEKIEGKVVCEVEVRPEMCNADGVLDQGAMIFLIDECSTLSMVVANAGEGRSSPPGVSCSINALFHGSALAGTTLRIVNRSLAAGVESNSGQTQVWDKENQRLIASGTQLTMPPSNQAKLMN